MKGQNRKVEGVSVAERIKDINWVKEATRLFLPSKTLALCIVDFSDSADELFFALR